MANAGSKSGWHGGHLAPGAKSAHSWPTFHQGRRLYIFVYCSIVLNAIQTNCYIGAILFCAILFYAILFRVIFLRTIVFQHFVLHHFVSRHFVSHHFVSCYFVLRHFISHNFFSHHFVWCHFVSRNFSFAPNICVRKD